MAVNAFSSTFTTFDTTSGSASGTVTYDQTGQGGVFFILQRSDDGITWTSTPGVSSLGNVASPTDGTNQTVSFANVQLPAGNDGTFFFRIVAQPLNNGGNPQGRELTANAVPSGSVTTCFLAGTHIATPTGNVVVESLAIGDLVLTADGRAVPVLWLGQQTVSTYFASIEARRPVLIQAGALGENLPVRDLRVTGDHAMLIDGVLVQAGAMVNGSSITRMTLADLGDRFSVFHIETENHEIVLAEGAATETFIDNVTRARFDNFAEFVALYGNESRPMEELAEPRAMSPRQVPPAIRAMIAARAAVLAGDAAAAA